MLSIPLARAALAALAPLALLAPQSPTRIVATLTPSGAGRLQGTLTLTPGRRDGETRARVDLLNAPPNQQLGWVIRKGQCGERGAELGPLAAYRPLQTRGDGSVGFGVNLPIAMPAGDAYHVDILQERGSDVALACGGLAEDAVKKDG